MPGRGGSGGRSPARVTTGSHPGPIDVLAALNSGCWSSARLYKLGLGTPPVLSPVALCRFLVLPPFFLLGSDSCEGLVGKVNEKRSRRLQNAQASGAAVQWGFKGGAHKRRSLKGRCVCVCFFFFCCPFFLFGVLRSYVSHLPPCGVNSTAAWTLPRCLPA